MCNEGAADGCIAPVNGGSVGGCTAHPLDRDDDHGSFALPADELDSQYYDKDICVEAGVAQISYRIDLTDPNQNRFVMNRLAAAGTIAENSPCLFEDPERMTKFAMVAWSNDRSAHQRC